MDIMELCLYGYTDRVKALLDEGADVNQTTSFGETPLHMAASFGHTDLVEVLLKAGADIYHLDNEGWSALSNAEDMDQDETVAFLRRELDSGRY